MISPYLQFQQIPQQNAWRLIPALYQQGIRNIKIAIWPKAYLSAFEAATITLAQRMKHIVVGVLLCLPIINLVTYIALRYFAEKNPLKIYDLEIIKDFEEIEIPKEIQQVEEAEEVKQQAAQILEQNVDLIISALPKAEQCRSSWCNGDFTLYEFELQMNAQGEIYKLTDESFTHNMKVYNVEHQKLYTVQLILFAAPHIAPDKTFKLKLNPKMTRSLPPSLIQMGKDLTAQLNDIPAKVMKKLSHLKTEYEQADWISQALGYRIDCPYTSIWRIRGHVWSGVLHRWKEFQHVFIDQAEKPEEEKVENFEDAQAAAR